MIFLSPLLWFLVVIFSRTYTVLCFICARTTCRISWLHGSTGPINLTNHCRAFPPGQVLAKERRVGVRRHAVGDTNDGQGAAI